MNNSIYKYATEKACQFLLRENIASFPVNIDNILSTKKWCILTYSQAALDLGISYKKLKHALHDSWGTVSYDGINYSIMYDDKLCIEAQHFTIMHEIGHIECGHLKSKRCIYTKGNVVTQNSESDYKFIENEANCFARNVLAPIFILEEIDYLYNRDDISENFGLSNSASKMRLDMYNNDLENAPEKYKYSIIFKFKDSLEEIAYKLGAFLNNTYYQVVQDENEEYQEEQFNNLCYFMR